MGIIVYPGVEELDFVGVYEVLSCVREVTSSAMSSVHLLGLNRNPVKCANGMVVIPHRTIKNALKDEVIVLPGGKGKEKIMKNQKLSASSKGRTTQTKLSFPFARSFHTWRGWTSEW